MAGIRQDLAAHLRLALNDEGVFVAAECEIYDAGVDIVDIPAIVINPGDPYEAVVTMKQEAIQVNLELSLITNRADPESAFTMLEDMRLATTRALRTMVPAFRWITHGGFGGVEVAGEVYAASMIEITTTMRERP